MLNRVLLFCFFRSRWRHFFEGIITPTTIQFIEVPSVVALERLFKSVSQTVAHEPAECLGAFLLGEEIYKRYALGVKDAHQPPLRVLLKFEQLLGRDQVA